MLCKAVWGVFVTSVEIYPDLRGWWGTALSTRLYGRRYPEVPVYTIFEPTVWCPPLGRARRGARRPLRRATVRAGARVGHFRRRALRAMEPIDDSGESDFGGVGQQQVSYQNIRDAHARAHREWFDRSDLARFPPPKSDFAGTSLAAGGWVVRGRGRCGQDPLSHIG